MEVKRLNDMGACSSLIIVAMGEISISGDKNDEYENPTPATAENFLYRFNEAARKSTLNQALGVDVTAVTEDGKRSYKVNRFEWTDYAFVTASTSQRQPKIEAILEEIGFTGSVRVKKNKNPREKCRFWVIPVPELIASYTRLVGPLPNRLPLTDY